MQDFSHKLGTVLVEKNLLDFATLEKALKTRGSENGRKRRNLAQILVADYKIDHHSVYREVAKLYGFQELKLTEDMLTEKRIRFIKHVMKKLPAAICELMEREKILVFRCERLRPSGLLNYTFVSIDPTFNHFPRIAAAMNTKRYEVCYINPRAFDTLRDKVFSANHELLNILKDSEIEITDDDDAVIEEDQLDAEINKSLLVQVVEGMLLEAVVRGASDIHIIPRDSRHTEIHLRIDGKLRLWHVQEGVRPEAMAAVVKDRSKNIDRFDRESAQDGFIQRNVGGHLIRYRVSVLPIVGREFQYKLESIVIRVLDDRKVITDFEKLGFQGLARDLFTKAISKPQGMIIVTGPTGSGKSTTLIAALNYIVKPEINVLTVEDPVEYMIPGVRQLKISPKNTFEQALRSILRHDPDVVMVGEIRDKVTAETAIKLANTGHLTFSTLHTNDAPSAVSRLYMMDIEPFLIAYAINIIIAQRLIRKLCEKCKRPIEKLDSAIPLSLGFSQKEIAQTTFYEAVGCDYCNDGYKGRVAIHETLFFSREIRQMIVKAGKAINEEDVRLKALEEGMVTLRAAGRQRVMQGTSTLEELVGATTDD